MMPKRKSKEIEKLDNIIVITNFLNATSSSSTVIDAANEYTLVKNRKLLSSIPRVRFSK